jgi:hypothetical protein
MNSMKLKSPVFLAAFIATGSLMQAAVIATDDFENNNPGTAYNDGIQYVDNGGSGFGGITYLEGAGGGLFDATLSGSRALGVFAGSGGGNTQGLGRTVTTTIAGTYTLQGRFDVDNATGFSGFNIKSSLGSVFGGVSELLSFGLTPGTGNTSIFVGGSINTSLAMGFELRGQALDFSLEFDTLAGTYTLGAKKTTDPTFTTVSGSLKDTNGGTPGVGSLAAVGFGNFNTGSSQNLVADNLSLVPEPASVVLGLAGMSLLLRRRR